ncbi:hypothetical protein I7I48_04701 [Histoplasma ohiense]|nr:hypothetical protein I7I48_04701 [Histoplasma ohiense (nom. inval.)]
MLKIRLSCELDKSAIRSHAQIARVYISTRGGRVMSGGAAYVTCLPLLKIRIWHCTKYGLICFNLEIPTSETA